MPTRQIIAPSVTVTWNRETPRARRRGVRLAGPVSVRRVPVTSPAPTDDEVAQARVGGQREQLALLLGGPVGGVGIPPELPTSRALALGMHAHGIRHETVLLALIEAGHSDNSSLEAVWWGSVDDRRSLVRVLLRHAGWSGERVHAALASLGFNALDRSRLVDPLADPRRT